MKKVLFSLLALVFSLAASAQLSTTITWDVPGSVEIYVGGTGEANKIDLPEGATQYTAVINNSWGSTYVGAASGYALKGGRVVETDEQLAVNSYTRKVVINMQTLNGKTVFIDSRKIVYDAEFTVNLINGREAVKCELGGTQRSVALHTGVQTIAYSTEFEPNVFFTAHTEGSEDPYILQDGEAVEWTDFYGTLENRNGYALTPGTAFEVKYCNTPDPEEEAHPVVTLSFADQKARQALTMIFNVTQFAAIYERESFEVKKGDQVRFVFNTKDYDVTFNGEAISPDASESTPHVVTVTADLNVSIAATDRQYGTTTVTLWTNDIDGLLLRDGAVNGPQVDEENIRFVGTESYTFNLTSPFKTLDLNAYEITVSEKSPKVFVEAANGYWIEASEYQEEGDYIPSSLATDRYVLKVLCNQLKADDRLVVYLFTDGVNAKADMVTLRDNNYQEYPLKNGYNEFLIDSSYANAFTASVMSDSDTAPSFSYFYDMVSVSINADTQQYTAYIEGDALLHIFAGRPTPSRYTVSATIAENITGATVVADNFVELKNGESRQMFAGTEVQVSPAEGSYTLDGEAPDYDGDVHTFRVTKNHEIVISEATAISEVVSASDRVTVTTIDGRIVLRQASAASLSALPKGVYIVNGKKIAI